VLLTEGAFLNSGTLFDVARGEPAGQVGLGCAAAVPGGLIRADGRSLLTYRRREVEIVDRKGKTQKVNTLEPDRIVPVDGEVREFLIAGSEAVVGSDGMITAIDYNGQRNQWWKHAVEGRVLGLAAGNGRIVATTDRGMVYLFDGSPDPLPPAAAPPPAVVVDAAAEKAAEAILSAAGIGEGYAVALGAGTGDLALALARKSQLNVLVVEPDAARADAARRRIADAGLHGSRISVHVAPFDATGFPKHGANLVVGADQVASASVVDEMRRLRHPFGGVLCRRHDGAIVLEKAPAPVGYGSWTHQNGNAANTLCSDDEVVKGRLTMRWFGDVPFEVANRHGQGPAPLVSGGRMVVAGVNGLCCIDVCNGRKLWEFELKNLLIDFDGIHHDVGVGDTGGPLCIGGDSVYVKTGPRCLRIDLSTGKLKGEFATPVAADAVDRNWGYLAWDNGILFGSVENRAHKVSPRYRLTGLRTESVRFFALDAGTGARKWQYEPKGSIRHNSVAVAAGKVYLIDRPIVEADRVTDFRRGGKAAPRLKADAVPAGTLLALDAETGKTLWKNDADIWGTQIAVSAKHNVLIMNYKSVLHNFFEVPSEVGGRLGAFDLATGAKLWDRQVTLKTRPLINDDKIYAQGGCWDLKTGAPVPWEFHRSYGCGQISSSRNLLLFRSATLGYVDLARSSGVENYGGIRPSCWINAVPASGLVLVPDGSSKCQCSYQMKAWFALQGE